MSTLEIHTEPNELAVVETVQQLTASETVQELSIQLSDNELTLDETIQVLDITNDVPTLDLSVNQATLEGQLEPLVINQFFGDASSFSRVEVTAGEALGGHRAVVVANNEAFYADPSSPSQAGQYVGITSNAAQLGDPVQVNFTGEMTESSWSWAPGSIYVGANGTLTQTRPTTGWVLNIATALEPTRVLINKTVAILRS